MGKRTAWIGAAVAAALAWASAVPAGTQEFAKAMEEGRWGEAAAEGLALAETLPRGPERCRVENDVAVARMNQGRWEEALGLLEGVEEACGLDAVVAYNLAHTHLMLGDHLEAVRYGSEAARLGYRAPAIWLVLAEGQAGLGRWEEALASFLAFREADPYRPEGHRGVVLALGRLGRWAEAAKAAEHILGMAPLEQFDPGFQAMVGRIWAHTGKVERGREVLKRLVSLSPFDPELLVAMADVELAAGDADRAMAVAQKAVFAGADPESVLKELGKADDPRWREVVGRGPEE
ncbi:tetratricopeptide repeat protein [Deferrisoma sp.]